MASAKSGLEVDIKHNEPSHFTALLEPLDLNDAVVTFDALHTVRANLKWLAEEKKAHYIIVVKKLTAVAAGVAFPHAAQAIWIVRRRGLLGPSTP